MTRSRLPSSLTDPVEPERVPALLVFLVGFLLFSLAACSAGTSSTTVPPRVTVPAARHPSPTPATLPAGTVLYQAQWSHGLAGWQGTRGWKVVQGHLEIDSSAPATLSIPYQPPVTGYALEVRLQIVRLLQKAGGYFAIFATKRPGEDGYQAGVSDLKAPGSGPFGSHPQAQAFIDPSGSTTQGTGIPIDYEPGVQWRTYRVEVQGNEVRLLVDGTQIGFASSDQTGMLSNGPLGLTSAGVTLRVSSLRILTV